MIKLIYIGQAAPQRKETKMFVAGVAGVGKSVVHVAVQQDNNVAQRAMCVNNASGNSYYRGLSRDVRRADGTGETMSQAITEAVAKYGHYTACKVCAKVAGM